MGFLDPSSFSVDNGFLYWRQKDREGVKIKPSGAEIKSKWSYTYTPLHAFMAWTGTT